MKTIRDLISARFGSSALIAIAFALCAQDAVRAQLVTLQNATATLSQTISGGQPVAQSIDGNLGSTNGWAIATSSSFGGASSETAVWESTSDVSTPGLTFTMHFLHAAPQHLLGRFRFSATTDNRSLFADGLDSGGDVTANWTVLSNPTVVGPLGMTFTTLGDQSVLAGGTVPNNGVFVVTYLAPLSGVTGFRLESLEDPSLPGGNGPGFASNGNFVLTELQANAVVPEPASLLLLTGAAASLLITWRRRNSC